MILWNHSFSTNTFAGEGGPIKITSVGQYRPEKDHPLQLQALFELRRILPESLWERVSIYHLGLLKLMCYYHNYIMKYGIPHQNIFLIQNIIVYKYEICVIVRGLLCAAGKAGVRRFMP